MLPNTKRMLNVEQLEENTMVALKDDLVTSHSKSSQMFGSPPLNKVIDY